MNKRGRNRNIVNMDRKCHMMEMAETKPPDKATAAFNRMLRCGWVYGEEV